MTRKVKKVGRPRKGPPKEKITTSITKKNIRIVKKLGRGAFNRGVGFLVEFYKKHSK